MLVILTNVVPRIIQARIIHVTIRVSIFQVDVQSDNDVEFFASTDNLTNTNVPTKANLPVEIKEIMTVTSNSTKQFNAGFLIYKNTSLFSIEAPEFKGAEVPQVCSHKQMKLPTLLQQEKYTTKSSNANT